MTKFPEWRLDWIDDQLTVGHPINRYDIVDLFGISYQAASTDIQTFLRLYTEYTDFGPLPPMRYDVSAKMYLPNRPFRSRRGSTRARRLAWRHLCEPSRRNP